MKKVSLGWNAFLNAFRNCLNLLFPLVTFPYVSHVLTINGMGIYNFSNTYVNYFLLIAGLGISTYAVREGTKYRDSKEKIEKFSSQIFSINLLSTVIAYLLLFITLIFFRNLRDYISCILIFCIQILFTTLGTEWLYVIYEDYTYITIRSILFKIFSMILLFLFVKKPEDYLIYAGITVLSGVGSNLLNYLHLKKFINLRITSKFNLKLHLKPILVIFASQLAVSIYVNSDNTILGLLKDDYAVGIYSVSVKIYNIAQGLLTSILMVVIPRLSLLYGKGLKKKYNSLLKKLLHAFLALSLPASLGLILLSKDIVWLIAGRKYIPSVRALQLISLAIVFSVFSWIFSDCVLIPAKREKYVFISTFITAFFNIILNLILIPFWSYDGTALSTVLSELMVLIMNAYYGRDLVSNIIFSKEFLASLVEYMVSCLGIIIICKIFNTIILNMIVRMILEVIISSIVYFIVLLLLRNSVAIFLYKYVKNKIIK